MAEGSIGIGTVIGILLILIGLGAFGIFLYEGSSGAQGAVKGVIGERGEVGKIFEEVFHEEDLVKEEDKAKAKKIKDFFVKAFDIKDDDCVKRINFDGIKTDELEGLGVRFERGTNKLDVVKGEELRVDRFYLSKVISYFKDANEMGGNARFGLIDDFTRIDGDLELGEWIYKKDNKISFLDKVTSEDFSGLYSPIFAKKICEGGIPKKREAKLVPGTNEIIKEYFDETISDIISHLWYLENANRDESIELYDLKLRGYTQIHFNEKYPKECWRAVFDIKGEGHQTGKLFSSGEVEGSNYENIEENVRFVDGGEVGKIELHRYYDPECRIDDTFEVFRSGFGAVGEDCKSELDLSSIRNKNIEVGFKSIEGRSADGGVVEDSEMTLWKTGLAGKRTVLDIRTIGKRVCFLKDDGSSTEFKIIYWLEKVGFERIVKPPFIRKPILYKTEQGVCFVEAENYLYGDSEISEKLDC